MDELLSNEQFKTFPVIHTERLILRRIIPEDIDALFELYSNPEIMRYRGAPEISDWEAAVHLLRLFEEQFREKTGIRWALALKEDESRLLGTAGIRNISRQHFRCETGYELSPAFWNRGLMTEGLREIAAYAFTALDMHTMEANIAPENKASERVLEKTGFVKEGHFRENWFYKGWWDSAIYTLHNPRHTNQTEPKRF